MGLDHHEAETAFGIAVAAVIKRRHPHNTSGLLAQHLRCTKKAAENVLAGHLSARSITRLTKAYGLSLLIEAGAAVTGETLETFLRSRAADARREAEHWERLHEQELPFDPSPTPPHRLAEHRSWDRRRP